MAPNQLWIMPNARDIAVNFLTDAIFTLFTIVFLTWVIRAREVRYWHAVEKKIRQRIAIHLQRLFDYLYEYFLEPVPAMPDRLEEKMKEAEMMVDGEDRERRICMDNSKRRRSSCFRI